MEPLEQRIAQVSEELRKLEKQMRRAGLVVSPDLARARRWELGRCVAWLYQRWQEFLFLHLAQPAPAYRQQGRPLRHAPRPD